METNKSARPGQPSEDADNVKNDARSGQKAPDGNKEALNPEAESDRIKNTGDDVEEPKGDADAASG